MDFKKYCLIADYNLNLLYAMNNVQTMHTFT